MTGKKKGSVLVLCAHSDDQVFGCGGTIAKYAKEGIEVNIAVFSYGEKSHPWMKKSIMVEARANESLEAAKVVNANDTLFFGIEEGKFKEDFERLDIKEKIEKLVEKYKPTKIFTHSSDDPMPDHNTLSKLIHGICGEIKYDGDLYAFDVWTPFKIKDRNLPKMYVDISDTFKTKIRALKCFKSHKATMVSLLWSVYFRAVKNGLRNKCRFAEVFYKLN